jgi:uncharacterized protein
MKSLFLTLFAAIFFIAITFAQEKRNTLYITNQAPLVAQPYTALPLGTIKPQGFLLKMLELQRDGLTGNLDSIYSVVCGPNNGWLGGTGDCWERGPYWIDGLVPLAYILDDAKLKAKAQQWFEWSFANQRENGYFGPLPLKEGFEKIPGTQQTNSEDWWPKMVMLKALQQYYTATGDKRVTELMLKYFKYQKEKLPQFPLGHWTYWGSQRGADNLAVVYWLYNITKEPFLLELGEIIHQQTFDWTGVYSGNMIRRVNPYPELHCVNVAQGLKAPVIYWQQHPEKKYTDALKNGLLALQETHGFINGMYGADEHLHGNDPTQGSELCSAVEMMFSFESVLPITGDMYYADYLEKVAYNVLPTQSTDDYLRKQYFQQPNQVLITEAERNFMNDHNGHLVYGTTTGYPCCLTNMHQGWPKFVQNLWYATAENGLAALVYGPSEVTAKVGSGEIVTITETTGYPFKDKISFNIKTGKNVKFPLHLRIPEWCKNPSLKVNGTYFPVDTTKKIIVVDREWKNGDSAELELPMEFRYSRWYENSLGIERGPLVYALRIEEDWREVKSKKYPDSYWEVYPKNNWNYALSKDLPKNSDLKAEVAETITDNPWNLANAPITVKTKGRQIPFWQIERNSAGKLPVQSWPSRKMEDEEDIVLIPYGCTTLRISEFPVY